jgi:hypothetical protein
VEDRKKYQRAPVIHGGRVVKYLDPNLSGSGSGTAPAAVACRLVSPLWKWKPRWLSFSFGEGCRAGRRQVNRMAAKRRSVTEEGDENWMPCGTCDRDGASWAQRCRQQQTGSPLAPCAALRSAASFGSVCAEIGQETRKRSRESASRCRHGRKQGRERRGSWDETTGGGSEVFGLVGIWTEGREPWTCKTEACVQSFCRKKGSGGGGGSSSQV